MSEEEEAPPPPPPPKKTPSVAKSTASATPDVIILEGGFGMVKDPVTAREMPVRSFTWHNRNRVSVQVITYGAAITKLRIPNRRGQPEDIVMGYEDMKGYLDCNNPYFGAIIGRVCNRIYRGCFQLNGEIYNVTKNLKFTHFMHGGKKGFDKVLWDAVVDKTKVTMTYLSKDGEEGFPGNLLVSVQYELKADNQFIIKMNATCTRPTPINLTSSSYFNLAGHGAGPDELEKHVVMINADSVCLTNAENIPTGQIRTVANKIVNLQVPKVLGEVIHDVPSDGFDHNLCITRGIDQDLNFVARVVHPPSGRVLEVYSNQPGVQFYTGNYLPLYSPAIEGPHDDSDEPPFEKCCTPGEYPCSKMGYECTGGEPCRPKNPDEPCCTMGDMPCEKLGYTCTGGMPCAAQSDKAPCCEPGEYPCSKMGFECNGGDPCMGTSVEADLRSGPIKGKSAKYYHKHGAFCLHTQNYPDAVNHENFPSCILQPGQTYVHNIVYKFWVFKHP